MDCSLAFSATYIKPTVLLTSPLGSLDFLWVFPLDCWTSARLPTCPISARFLHSRSWPAVFCSFVALSPPVRAPSAPQAARLRLFSPFLLACCSWPGCLLPIGFGSSFG